VQAVYHADFEKNIRGTITSVTDDPEMKRAKEVANVISQAAYTRGYSNSENVDVEQRFCKSLVWRSSDVTKARFPLPKLMAQVDSVSQLG